HLKRREVVAPLVADRRKLGVDTLGSAVLGEDLSAGSVDHAVAVVPFGVRRANAQHVDDVARLAGSELKAGLQRGACVVANRLSARALSALHSERCGLR